VARPVCLTGRVTSEARAHRPLLLRAPKVTIAIAAVLAVVATITLLGGFSDVPQEKLPVVEIGKPYAGNEATVTVTSSYLSPTRPSAPGNLDPLPAGEGKQFLIVETRIENTTTTPSYIYGDIVRVLIDNVLDPSVDPDANLDARTGSQLGLLQPGLTLTVDFLWEIDQAAAAPGDDLIIGILDRVPVANDPVFGDSAFTRPSPVARILSTIGEAP